MSAAGTALLRSMSTNVKDAGPPPTLTSGASIVVTPARSASDHTRFVARVRRPSQSRRARNRSAVPPLGVPARPCGRPPGVRTLVVMLGPARSAADVDLAEQDVRPEHRPALLEIRRG